MTAPTPQHDQPESGVVRGTTRREFLTATAGIAVSSAAIRLPNGAADPAVSSSGLTSPAEFADAIDTTMTVNGQVHRLKLDPRASLLDTLRETLGFTGTKKGCDQGACGACTVHVDGKRVNSCLMLAVQCDGRGVTTIEGLEHNGELHPMQAAFVKCDGFQCGYCTPGQIMSAVAAVDEGHVQTAAQVREWMSGNLCRCGAYPNIVDAVLSVGTGLSKGSKASRPAGGR